MRFFLCLSTEVRSVNFFKDLDNEMNPGKGKSLLNQLTTLGCAIISSSIRFKFQTQLKVKLETTLEEFFNKTSHFLT